MFIWDEANPPRINGEFFSDEPPDERPLFSISAVWNSDWEGPHEVWFYNHSRSLWDGELAEDEPLEFSLEVRADNEEEAKAWFEEYIIPQTEGGDEEWDTITITKLDD